MDVTDGTLFQLRGASASCSSHRSTGATSTRSQAVRRACRGVCAGGAVAARLRALPRLRDAMPHRIEVVLDEGEVLFIPACCAHEISGEPTLEDGTPVEHVLSVNRFWRTDPKLVRKHMPQDALPSYNATMAFD